ncbi:MAG: tetratricopeptide repeat protein, partial [Bacteroidales bacterium]|nr:tetratricopeptide repeat protein [Bacteroidales bacterium]
IGTCLQQLGQVEKAIDYYLQALKIDQELGNYRGVATQLTQIGGYLLLKNEPLQALNYLNKSQELAHRYNYKEIVRDNYQQLVAINMALLNYEMAYESLQKYSALRDSMTLDTLVINQLSGLSQTSLSEQVKKQTTGLLKWRNLLIISLLANIVFAIIFIYRRRRKVAR